MYEKNRTLCLVIFVTHVISRNISQSKKYKNSYNKTKMKQSLGAKDKIPVQAAFQKIEE